MAYAVVILEQPHTGRIRTGKLGFSWWMFLFGPLVPMFRSDWKHTAISFFVALITSGLSWFVYPFFYNKWHLKSLLLEGYKVTELVGVDPQRLTQIMGMRVPMADVSGVSNVGEPVSAKGAKTAGEDPGISEQVTDSSDSEQDESEGPSEGVKFMWRLVSWSITIISALVVFIIYLLFFR